MKKIGTILFVFCFSVHTVDLHAQSGKVGINTNSPLAVLHVKDSSVLFTGPASLPVTPGNPPVSGAGIRMMWYADKAAFRAGMVNDASWDKDNIGILSFGFGNTVRATGSGSFAFGALSSASGTSAVAMGSTTSASGNVSVALGTATTASGFASTALGGTTAASGNYSLATGQGTVSRSFASSAFGRYNDSIITSSTDSWVAGDPLFLIGNGSSSVNRSNAFAVLKNGNVGIGANTLPAHRLHILNNNNADGGWTEGIVVENISDYANAGEAAISFKNAALAPGKYWMTGINQQTSGLAFNYGSFFSSANTRMIVDTSGKVGIGTVSPLARLHIVDSSVLFTGVAGSLPISPANPPASGAGTRMMWYPDKAAFRAGRVIGDAWDKDSIGDYSIATGFNNKAKGRSSFATGESASAIGLLSSAMGFGTVAYPFASLVIGRYNDSVSTSNPAAWSETDPIFIIGNGTAINARSNALTILKNGDVQRGRSGQADMLPIYHGNISSTGVVNAGTSNFSVVNISTGVYELSLLGDYNPLDFVTIVTPAGDVVPKIATTRSLAGKLRIQIFDLAGNFLNSSFHIVIYRP
jgi:hypothetical protein